MKKSLKNIILEYFNKKNTRNLVLLQTNFIKIKKSTKLNRMIFIKHFYKIIILQPKSY